MTLIVNLSTVHTLYPASKAVQSYEKLCRTYSTGCFSSCSSFFQSWSNSAWVWYQYTTNDRQLIQPYRHGAITTEQFLNNLLQIFSFLEKATPEAGDLERLQAQKLYSNDFAFSVLEEAWNSPIDMDETRIGRFSSLAALNEPIYLISNTNELNVLKIIRLLQEHNPDIQFKLPIDLSVKKEGDRTPIEIAPNIFLCLSYRYQLFKTLDKNREMNPNSTMSLLNYLVNEQLSDRTTIQVVSQHDADLVEAKRIGIAPEKIISADVFFNDVMAHGKKIK